MNASASEKGPKLSQSVEQKGLVVSQPQKLEGLLETISLLDKVSESIGGVASGDWSGAGSTGGTQQQAGQSGTSARDQAIAAIPQPAIIQKQLAKHIEKEVKKLQREVKSATRRITKPGNAYKINKLYARIRRLNGLLSELADASLEVLKRLFIRIFIDKQSVV